MKQAPLSPEILSLDPVRPPKPVRSFDLSRPVNLSEIVSAAGMRNVVSGSDGTSTFLVDGDRDLIMTRPGQRLYGVCVRGLPENERDRAREILRRLAYGFHDWAAREIVSRHHRDVKRGGPDRAQPERVSPVDRVLRILRKENGATIGRISRATGLAQSNVTRTVRLLEKKGLAYVTQVGRNVLVYAIEEVPHDSALR